MAPNLLYFKLKKYNIVDNLCLDRKKIYGNRILTLEVFVGEMTDSGERTDQRENNHYGWEDFWSRKIVRNVRSFVLEGLSVITQLDGIAL